MRKLKQRIHDNTNGLDYDLSGGYYIAAIGVSESDDRPIGKWGRY